MACIIGVNSFARKVRRSTIEEQHHYSTTKVCNETADYLCERGCSVDEEPQGNTSGHFEVRCSHTGSSVFVRFGAEQCLFVVCADVPM